MCGEGTNSHYTHSGLLIAKGVREVQHSQMGS